MSAAAFYPDGRHQHVAALGLPTYLPRALAGDSTVDFVAVRQDGLIVVRGAELAVVKPTQVGLEVRR